MALLKIYIDGQGPFNFVLDTGASTSGVDQSIADALHLPRAGRAVKVAGVSEVTRRGQVRVAHWRMGDHPLPPHTLVTLDMPDKGGGVRLDGLFGSDMLNLFGLVRIDYERGYLVLPARQESMVERPQSQNLASLLRWPG